LQHASEQIEADVSRLVEVEIAVLALGEPARWLQAAPLGGAVRLTGFLAAKSRSSKMPVLHLNSIEFLEGNENGSILQEEG
jgi:primosomal replication protein N